MSILFIWLGALIILVALGLNYAWIWRTLLALELLKIWLVKNVEKHSDK